MEMKVSTHQKDDIKVSYDLYLCIHASESVRGLHSAVAEPYPINRFAKARTRISDLKVKTKHHLYMQ